MFRRPIGFLCFLHGVIPTQTDVIFLFVLELQQQPPQIIQVGNQEGLSCIFQTIVVILYIIYEKDSEQDL